MSAKLGEAKRVVLWVAAVEEGDLPMRVLHADKVYSVEIGADGHADLQGLPDPMALHAASMGQLIGGLLKIGVQPIIGRKDAAEAIAVGGRQ